MNPLDLLDKLNAAGVVLSARGGKLAWDAPKGAATPDLLAAMKHAKPILLAMLAGDWQGAAVAMIERLNDPDRRADLLEQFHERAGIIEYDGGMNRIEAERLAMDQVAADLCQLDQQQSEHRL